MIDTQVTGGEVLHGERVYRRDLPGAGFVEIDVHTAAAAPGERAAHCTRLFVERREERERRIGHTPPVLAEIVGDDTASATGELFRLASDNAALARALLEWQSRHSGVTAE